MKKNTLTRIVMILALLGVVFGSLGIASPALAQTPAPVDPGQPDPAVTVVVPDTGGNNVDNGGFAISGWTLLVILGFLVVILLIALVSRGSHTHTVD